MLLLALDVVGWPSAAITTIITTATTTTTTTTLATRTRRKTTAMATTVEDKSCQPGWQLSSQHSPDSGEPRTIHTHR